VRVGSQTTGYGAYTMYYVAGAEGVSNGALTSGATAHDSLNAGGLTSYTFSGTSGKGMQFRFTGGGAYSSSSQRRGPSPPDDERQAFLGSARESPAGRRDAMTQYASRHEQQRPPMRRPSDCGKIPAGKDYLFSVV